MYNGTRGYDMVAIKLGAVAGGVQWTKFFYSQGSNEDRGWAVVVGPDDHPVFTGTVVNNDGTANYLTIKLQKTNGSTIWSRPLPGASNNIEERAGWLAVCDNGDVVMANRTWTVATSYDVVLHRYAASNGATVWAKQHGAPGAVSDDPRMMVRDAAGNFLIAGVRSGNMLVMKCRPNDGEVEWTAVYNGPANGYDLANSVVEGPGGVVVAAGFSTGVGTSWDVTTLGVDPVLGGILWSRRYDSGEGQPEEGSHLAVNALGDIYVVGYGYRLATDSDLLSLRYHLDLTSSVAEAESAGSLRAYPNPFRGEVRLLFDAPGRADAQIAILDASGRKVATVPADAIGDGRGQAVWDGRDGLGRLLRPGVYWARIESAGGARVRKLIRIE